MTVRLIHVGLGGWGRNWAKDVVAQNPAVETVAWVDMVPEVLTLAQQSLDLPEERCFLRLEKALETYEADAVLITANLPGHVPSALTALKAGKHVLLEKPFAPTIEEAREVVETAEKNNLLLLISQNYRFNPIVKAAARLVKEQIVGPVSTINLDFRRYANSAPVATNRHYTIWHPLLVDMSIHHFDLMRVVLNQNPVRISCTTWNPSWSHFVEPPAGVATIYFDGGAVVSYRGSWVSTKPATNWSGEWSMECEQGEIFWTSRGEFPERLEVRRLKNAVQALKVPAMQYVDRDGSLAAFVHAIESGELSELSSTGRDNLKTLALMYAAVESAEANGKPVDISPYI